MRSQEWADNNPDHSRYLILNSLQISAQESRRKKKEYVEGLERRVNVFSSVNENLKQRLTELEVITIY